MLYRQVARKAAAAAVTGAVVFAAACGSADRKADGADAQLATATPVGMGTVAGQTAVSGTAGDPGSLTGQTSRDPFPTDPDHHLLRDLVDANEGMVLLAHSAMEKKHEHRMSADPALEADVNRDAEKSRMVALLRSRFADQHEPSPSAQDRAEVDSIMRLSGESYEAAFQDFRVRHDRMEVAMIERALPQLHDAQVRALARETRAAHSSSLQRAAAAGNPAPPTSPAAPAHP